MARPRKIGLDYFPLDVDADEDDKFQLLEAEHGIEGFGIVIKMMAKIYRNGYYYKWTETEQLLFSKRISVTLTKVIAVINTAIKRDIFNQDMYNRHKILTSTGIQKRYAEVSKRRINKNLDFWLLKNKELVNEAETNINEAETNINEAETNINVNKNSRKKSKEKKSMCNTNDLCNINDYCKQLLREDNKLKMYDINYYDERVCNYYGEAIKKDDTTADYLYWKQKILLFIQNDERDGKAVKIKTKEIKPHEYAEAIVMRFREELLKKKAESNGNFNEVTEAKEIQDKISTEPEFQKMVKIYGGQIDFSIICEIERLQ